MDEMLTRVLLCMGQKRGSQKALAEHLGIHPNVITNWKRGTNKSYRGYAEEIAKFYGVSAYYLQTGRENENALIGKDERELINGDPELTDYLQSLAERSEMRMLFHVTKNATKEQIEAIVKMVESMRGK